jgi:hypothetical protein
MVGVIYDKWLSMGGDSCNLGLPISDSTHVQKGSPFAGDFNAGYFNNFEKGSIYSCSYGAFAIWGAIRDKWTELGRENSVLGFPVTDECGNPDNIGRYNDFEFGSVYWSPQTGACALWGNVGGKWAALGWESGWLGYPTTDQCVTPDGYGRYAHFQGGSIYWTPATGACAIHKKIRNCWERTGWEQGYLGYPINDSIDSYGSALGMFQGGSISWTALSDAVDSSPYKILSFSVERLFCHEETGVDDLWLSNPSDEPIISAVGFDEYLNTYHSGQIPLYDVDTGDSFGIYQALCNFPLTNPGWSKTFIVIVLCAEDEGGDGLDGLSQIQQQIAETAKSEITKALTTAGVTGVATLIGVEVGGVLGAGIGAVIGAIAGYLVGEVIDYIMKQFGEQWFPAQQSIITLPTIHGQSVRQTETLDFQIEGGHYDIDVAWKMLK